MNSANREPIDLAALARLEERRELRAIRELNPSGVLIAGGIMVRGEPGSWINKAMGMGLDGPVSEHDLDALEAFYREAGVEPRIEVNPYADRGLLKSLESRRYMLRDVESMLFRELHENEVVRPAHDLPGDITIRIVDTSDVTLTKTVCETMLRGFVPEPQPLLDDDRASAMKMLMHPRTKTFAAFAGEKCVAAGCCGTGSEIAAIFGASTTAEFRKRGIQQALLAARVNHCARTGSRVATIGSRPGIATERNVRRMGFQVAYYRFVFALPGEGLVPVKQI